MALGCRKINENGREMGVLYFKNKISMIYNQHWDEDPDSWLFYYIDEDNIGKIKRT